MVDIKINYELEEKIKLSREYLKSYYSINSYIGCTINCGYCFLAPINIVPMRPKKIIDEKRLVDEMINDNLFVVNETVVSINNRTDPFVNEEVKESTFKILEYINEKMISNPITITTKGLLTEKDISKLDQFDNTNIYIIVTYNGIPEHIQPISHKIQEETMRNVAKSKRIKLLHQFRPIIPNVNDNEKTIRDVLQFASKYCQASIYQGLRMNEKIDYRLRERNYSYNGKYDKHKQKSSHVDKIFLKIYDELCSYPIFDHTSCAISYIIKQADYNQHFLKNNCNSKCKNFWQCNNNYRPCKNEDIKLYFNRIGIGDKWKINNGQIIIDEPISDEQRSFIRHIMHRESIANERIYSFSEQLMD